MNVFDAIKRKVKIEEISSIYNTISNKDFTFVISRSIKNKNTTLYVTNYNTSDKYTVNKTKDVFLLSKKSHLKRLSQARYVYYMFYGI
jgi:hypothetical protein